jgi:hypothetical protein
MTTDYSPRELRTFRIRRKTDTSVADPTAWAVVDGNSCAVTVGGTASDGNYVVTVTPVTADVVPVDRTDVTVPPITVARATTPATNANIATAFVTATNTLLTATAPGDHANLSTYIESVSAAAEVVTFIVKRNAPPFRFALSETTATGTLVASPIDTFPITFSTIGRGPTIGARNKLSLVIIPVNSSGVQLTAGTLTADITVRRYFDRARRSQDRDIPAAPVGVESATTQAALAAGANYRIPGGGGRFGVTLGAVAGAVGAGVLAAVEVHIREVTE